MEKEISSGAMLGIVLIALAAIIALGFGIFSIARGVTNEGMVDVQDSLESVSLSTFAEYDQKVVTGTQVMSAYKGFENKPVAILIATSAFVVHNDNDVIVTPNESVAVSGKAQFGDDDDGVVRKALTGPSTAMTIKAGGQTGLDLVLVNYNALLESDITYHEGEYNATGFIMEDNKVQYNLVTGSTGIQGRSEYVPVSARFQSNLVKDPLGTIIGIGFYQIER